MREQIQERLQVLRKEFETGQRRQQELQREQMVLQETLLRIGGAIQVLEELVADSGVKSEAEVLPMERR